MAFYFLLSVYGFVEAGQIYIKCFFVFLPIYLIFYFLIQSVVINESGIGLLYAFGQKEVKIIRFILWSDVNALSINPKRLTNSTNRIRYFFVISKNYHGEFLGLFSKNVIRFGTYIDGYEKIIDKIVEKVPEIFITEDLKIFLKDRK
jgi:hypothetical protein